MARSVLQSSWRICLVSAKIMKRWCMAYDLNSPLYEEVMMMLSSRLQLLLQTELCFPQTLIANKPRNVENRCVNAEMRQIRADVKKHELNKVQSLDDLVSHCKK